jgi:phosphonate transport system substrate-binding protein
MFFGMDAPKKAARRTTCRTLRRPPPCRSMAPKSGEGAASKTGELRMKKLVLGALLAASALATAAHAQNVPTIRVGWTIPAEEAKYWMMRRPDKFPNLGKTYKIEWSQFQGTSPMAQALIANALDCATQGVLPIAQGMDKGTLDTYVVAQHVGEKPGSFSVYWAVKDDSPIKTVADLKGKKVAHVSPSSNSGDLAPRALFSSQGVVPGKDYEVLYSGKHDNSIMGVVNKDYDAAPVASTVVERMQARGMFKAGDLRVIYQSAPFPRTAFGVPHNLAPELKAKIREAFLTFDFKNSKLGKEFKDTEKFGPIDYKDHWRDVRTIQQASGVKYNQDALNKLSTKAE